MLRPRISAFAFLLAVAAPLAADPLLYPPAFLPTHDYWAPAGAEGVAVAGCFDDDAAPDVVALVGGVPHLVRDVETLGYFVAAGDAVNDLDVWPGGAPNGRDAVVTASGAGLMRLHFDDASGTLVKTVLDGTATWADTDFVRAGDVDGDGKVDVVGLRGGLVLVRRDVAGPGGSTSSFAAHGAGHALALVDEDGDGADRIAVAHGAGITLYSGAGHAASTAFPAATYRELRAIPAGGSCERLTALTTIPAAGDQMLYVGDTALDSCLTLGASLDFVSAAPVVFAPGGAVDLVLSSRGTGELVVLRHTGSTPAYSIYNVTANFLIQCVDEQQQPNTVADPARAATLVSIDEDGDGDQALFVFDDALGVFRLVRNQLVDETAWRPGVALNGHTAEGAGPDAYRIDWDVLAPSVVEPSATTIRMDVHRVPLAGEGSFPTWVAAGETATTGGTVTVTVDTHDTEVLRYIAVVRQVEEAGGVEVRAWPVHTFEFQVSEAGGGDPVPVNGPITRPNGGESDPPPPPPGGGE